MNYCAPQSIPIAPLVEHNSCGLRQQRCRVVVKLLRLRRLRILAVHLKEAKDLGYFGIVAN